MNHTKEPWEVLGVTVWVATQVSDDEQEQQPIGEFSRPEDAERSQVCVNALAGIESPAEYIKNITSMSDKVHLQSNEYRRQIQSLTDRNKKLVEACDCALTAINNRHSVADWMPVVNRLKNALAEDKGAGK